jgi:acetolactate synthase-1/2/3 large subunit
LNIPVAHTFMGKGIVPDSDALSLYTIGLQMRDHPAAVFEQADVVIAAGYDFVEYAPCFWNPNRDKRVVHVDVSPAEVDAHYIVEVGVLGDIALCLDQIGAGLSPFDAQWARRCRETIVTGFEQELASPPAWPLRPQHVIRELRAALSAEDIVICDVGAHKLWMARMFPCEAPNTCIISNGLAAMGIGVPGAIAAKLLFPQRRVVTVTGDGGFLMNVQELETARRLGLPLVALIFRDDGYGSIRWKQEQRFRRTAGVEFGNPDFVRLAEAFGCRGFRVETAGQLSPILREALAHTGPALIDCPVDYRENDRLGEG